MHFYLDDKKITRKRAEELNGSTRLEEMIAEAKEDYARDPYTEFSWFIGSGMFRIEIESN